MLTPFMALSRVLTGDLHLDDRLGTVYLERLNSTPHQVVLGRALARFEALTHDTKTPHEAAQALLEDDSLRPTLCQLILLWYTSALQDNPASPGLLRFGSAEEYFSGLGWQIVEAHVPGLSGGHFGHWRYRP
jgi:hypothetical protein